MERQTILEEFKSILFPYTPDKEKLNSITEDTRLLEDLHINSANLVDIVIDTESKFNIEMDMDSLEKITTVGSCIDVINIKQGVVS